MNLISNGTRVVVYDNESEVVRNAAIKVLALNPNSTIGIWPD